MSRSFKYILFGFLFFLYCASIFVQYELNEYAYEGDYAVLETVKAKF